jgi:hypothetical protein
MSYSKTFCRLFLIAFAVQLIVYGLFVQFGTDKATSGITVFGHACFTFYYPVFAITLLLPQSIIGTGLRGFGLLFWLAPAIGAVVYSTIFATGVLLFRRVREKS